MAVPNGSNPQPPSSEVLETMLKNAAHQIGPAKAQLGGEALWRSAECTLKTCKSAFDCAWAVLRVSRMFQFIPTITSKFIH